MTSTSGATSIAIVPPHKKKHGDDDGNTTSIAHSKKTPKAKGKARQLMWTAVCTIGILAALLWLPSIAERNRFNQTSTNLRVSAVGSSNLTQISSLSVEGTSPTTSTDAGSLREETPASSSEAPAAIEEELNGNEEQLSSPAVTARNSYVPLTDVDEEFLKVTANTTSVCPSLFPIKRHRQRYKRIVELRAKNNETLFGAYELPYLLGNGSMLYVPEDPFPYPILNGTVCINALKSGSSSSSSSSSSPEDNTNPDKATLSDASEYVTHGGPAISFDITPAAPEGTRQARVGSHATSPPTSTPIEHGLLLVLLVSLNNFHATQDTFIPIANLIRTRLLKNVKESQDMTRFPLHVWVARNDFQRGGAVKAAKEIAKLLATDFNIASVRVGGGGDGGPQRRCFECGVFVGEHAVNRIHPNDPLATNKKPAVLAQSHGATLNAHREGAVSMLRARLAKAYNMAPYGEEGRVRAREEAAAIWKGNAELHVELLTEGGDEKKKKRAWMPRLLLVGRRENRKIGNIDALEEIAVKAGFNVKKVYFDGMAFSEQFRLVRYADVLVSIHGAALTWMLALDTETILVGADNKTMRSGHNCRTVLELRHWGRKFRGDHNVYKGFSTDGHILHLDMAGSTVAFDPGINAKRATKILMNKKFPHGLPEFHKQTVFYDPASFRVVMQHLLDHLDRCLFF